jgi:hypothetical protein
MQNEKQFYFFSTLTPTHWLHFIAFLDFSLVESTPPVAAADIKQLAVFLKKHYTARKGKTDLEVLDNAALFAAVFPKRPFVQGRFERVHAVLRREFEKFIVYKSANNDAFFPKIMMAQFYFEQKNVARFERTMEKLKTELYAEQAKDRYDFAKIYWAELLDSEFQIMYNVKKGDINYQEVVDALDIFYLTSRLDWLCVLFNQKRMVGLNTEKEEALLVDLDGIIEKKGLTDTPSVKVYRMAIDLLLDKGELDDFQKTITEADACLTFEQRQKLHALERNFFTARYNAGQKTYLPVITDLLKAHLAAGYLYYESGLIPSTLQNLTTIGLRAGEFHWVEQLLIDHKDRIISQDDPQEIYNLNLAKLQFALGNFEDVLTLLNTPYKFRDIYCDLTSRALRIKALYEKKDTGVCQTCCEAFKNYLFNWKQTDKTNSLPTPVFGLNNNFVNIVLQLLDTLKGDTKRVKSMFDKVENSRIYGEQEWLMEKLKDLL